MFCHNNQHSFESFTCLDFGKCMFLVGLTSLQDMFLSLLFVCLPIVLFFRRTNSMSGKGLNVKKKKKSNVVKRKAIKAEVRFILCTPVIIKLSLQSRRVHRNASLQYKTKTNKKTNPNISDTKSICVFPRLRR